MNQDNESDRLTVLCTNKKSRTIRVVPDEMAKGVLGEIWVRARERGSYPKQDRAPHGVLR